MRPVGKGEPERCVPSEKANLRDRDRGSGGIVGSNSGDRSTKNHSVAFLNFKSSGDVRFIGSPSGTADSVERQRLRTSRAKEKPRMDADLYGGCHWTKVQWTRVITRINAWKCMATRNRRTVSMHFRVGHRVEDFTWLVEGQTVYIPCEYPFTDCRDSDEPCEYTVPKLTLWMCEMTFCNQRTHLITIEKKICPQACSKPGPTRTTPLKILPQRIQPGRRVEHDAELIPRSLRLGFSRTKGGE
ncbi:hypothetical protein B0H13DRAFT_2416537 [Mycena leptocephala]|nr:hypothetical protein B0H13DRAFT_2416537 [Mycena leptocephala]